MKKIFKQSFSLILALLMVLSMVPAMSLVADAAAIEYGPKWEKIDNTTYGELNAKFSSKDHDYIYYGKEAYDWAFTLQPTNTAINGQKVTVKVNVQYMKLDGSGKESRDLTDYKVTVDNNNPVAFLAPEALGSLASTEINGHYFITCNVVVGTKAIITVKFGFSRYPEITSGSRWSYLRTSETETYEYLNGAINFADNSWTVTLNPTQSVDLSVATIDAQIVDAKGNVIDSVEGKAVTGNPVLSLGNFPVAKSKMGTYAVKATFKAGTTPVAALTAIYKLAPATPGTVDTEYKNSGDQLSHEFVTRDPDMVYGAGQDYDWHVTVGPLQDGANLKIQASIQDENGNVIGTVGPKDVEVPAAAEATDPATTMLSADEFANLTSDLTGTFTLYYQIANAAASKVYVTTTATFARTAEPGAYPGGFKPEYADGWESRLNGSFEKSDEDLIYIGEQPYDWAIYFTPKTNNLANKVVDIEATVTPDGGEAYPTYKHSITIDETVYNKKTKILSADCFPELTGAYGTFRLVCDLKYSGDVYGRVTVQFSRIEGETPKDTVAPVFSPNWEGCGIPNQPIQIKNDGDYPKTVDLKLTFTDPNGTVLYENDYPATEMSVGKVLTFAYAETGNNQVYSLMNKAKVRGVYTVTITGTWNEDNAINQVITYNWLEHTNTEAVPGYAATCTETGLTDGVFCNGCESTIVEQEKIPIDPNAHTFVDGVCTGCELIKFVANTSIALQNSVALQFVVNYDVDGDGVVDLIGDDNYAIISKRNKDTGEFEYFTEVPQSEWALYSGKLYTAACKIAARQMTDEFKIVLYNSADQQISTEFIDSARAYGIRAINNLTANGTKTPTGKKAAQLTMFIDFLNYGAAAQMNFKYNTDDLANEDPDGIIAAYQSWATASITPVNGREGDGTSQVSVKDRIELSFLFAKATVTQDMHAVITYTHFKGAAENVTIEGGDFGTYSSYWQLPVPNIGTPDGDAMITCVVYDANGNEVARAKDSVNSYMARALESPKASAETKALATAAIKLTTSSFAFFTYK